MANEIPAAAPLFIDDGSSVPSKTLSDAASQDDEKLKEACKAFEGVLMGQMMTSMRPKGNQPEGDEDSQWFQESPEESMYSDMLFENIGNLMSQEQHGIGLANLLYQQLTEKQ